MENHAPRLPSRVLLAVLLSAIFHGLFIVGARYRLSYDAFTHMFFADHYARDWFSLWEPRWFGGFEIVSYPPLVHQLIALLSRLVGIDAAYAGIQWIVVTIYPVAVYGFSRVFWGRSASAFAALGTAFLPSLYYAAYAFGQLPTLTATLFALFGLASLADFLRSGNGLSGLLAMAMMAVTMAAHHATLLFLPWPMLAIVAHLLLETGVNRWVFFRRFCIILLACSCSAFVVIWPFWVWGAAQQLQTPIDHLSRHNFFNDPSGFLAFFLPMYGAFVILIPFVLWKGWSRRLTGLTLAFVALCVLGLGGTTPLPRLLFGDGWEWLTYDRFALWGSLLLVPFFGPLAIVLRRAILPHIRLTVAISRPTSLQPLISLRRLFDVRTLITILTFGVFALISGLAGSIPSLFHTQPPALDMGPIVGFLQGQDRAKWRYLTFGFGDQMALLSRLTAATTIDGSYFTARTLPELRESGVGLIDTAFWGLRGISALDPILAKSGERGVRWGFVDRKEYVPFLKRQGWVFVQFLNNGVQVWENRAAIMPEPEVPPAADPFAAFSWGIFPMFSLLVAIAVGTLRAWPGSAAKFLRGAHTFLLGLVPLSCAFWYFRVIGRFPHSQVYFTYDHALFFISDGLVALALTLWLIGRLPERGLSIPRFSPTLIAAFSLCSLISLSILWSADRRTSQYLALHFWLLFGLVLSMREWPESWTAVALGLCALLSVEAVAGFVGFVTQSTDSLAPFALKWPGLIDAVTQGASIMRLQDGQSFLRAYGTLPHPNILGGFILVSLLGPSALVLRKEKPNRLALLLMAIGSSLAVMTFSRSAWLGMAAFLSIIACKSQNFGRRQVLTMIAVAVASISLTLLPLRDLFISRTTDLSASTERFALAGRVFLTQQAFALIGVHPVGGVGAGSFVIRLAQRAGEFNYVEPVHNIPLLVISELGVFSLAPLLAIAALIAKRTIESREPRTILAGALLAGLGVVGLFDHYLWTLAPGRVMLGIALGLWEGQSARDVS